MTLTGFSARPLPRLARLASATRAAAPCVGALVEVMEPRRLLAAGDLDPTFGAGGIRHFDPTLFPNGVARGVAVQADGKMVSVGSGPSGNGGSGFAIVRYLPDGSPDPSF